MSPSAPLDAALAAIEAAILSPRDPLRATQADPGRDLGDVGEFDASAETGPSDSDEDALYDGRVDEGVVTACAGLDHSDTDNGVRLKAHFGQDLRVMRIADAKSPAYVVWAGSHWDPENGTLLSHKVAQCVGGRIGLEADFLGYTGFEKELMAARDRAKGALAHLAKVEEPTASDRKAIRAHEMEVRDGDIAEEALSKRQAARRKFAVSSKNKARIEAMLICAAPHVACDPDDFNADPFVLATAGHTLVFSRAAPAVIPSPSPAAPFREASLTVRAGHDRADMLTRVVPVAYDAAASCPKWRAFLDEFLPDREVRAFVQGYSGLGLLGRTVQMLLFHYGSGANGKSVFLETLMRVLGPLGVGLPAESVTGGGDRASGGASPDLARLYGARTVRILELPADKPLHEDLVKKLTGGEKIPVRTLFKGYFDFTPVFTAHMSGNGYPQISGTDNGIWRRMKVVHWPIELPPERQREFDDVLADFAPEYPGILNWLIDGALVFLERGLIVPKAVTEATDEYRSAMDPIRDFVTACVDRVTGEDGQPDDTASVTAREMYEAYKAWGDANAHKPFSETRFGRDMKKRVTRTDERVRRYLGVRLHDVPARTWRRGGEDYEPSGER